MAIKDAVYNSVLTAAQRAIGKSSGGSMSPSPMPDVRDASNYSAELAPWDLKFIPDEPTPNEDFILQEMERCWKDAKQAQVGHHAEWFNAWTFYLGKQWRTWSREQNRYLDTKPASNESGYDPNRRYRSYNHIRPLVDKNHTKALSTKPTPQVSPLTPRPSDIGATRESRGVIAHSERQYDGQVAEACQWAEQVAAPCIKVYWDNTQPALLPRIGPNGEILDVIEDPSGGEIVREIVSPFEWFPDPKAKTFSKCQYIIHAQVVPLSYVQERFKKGWNVKPDAMTADISGIEGRMAQVVGDTDHANGKKLDGVLLCEKWEKRSSRYKKGRLITWANGILLRYEEKWPDGDGTKLPFIPIYYKKDLGTPYGSNAVTPLIDGQILINKTMSRREEWCDESTWFILLQKGAEAGADAFNVVRDRLATKVYVNPGFPPQFLPTPPMNADMMNLDASAVNFMRDNIGVHEVSDGRAPAGVDAGVAIQLLQQSDDTQLASYVENIGRAECDIAERVLEIARNKYLEPRLVMVADTANANPDDARSQIMMFQHISDGRVVVTPGTSTTENPVVRAQKIMDMGKAGFFTPQQLPVTMTLLKLLQFENPDKLTDDLSVALQQVLAQQPDPAQIQAQSQQAQAAQAAQQQEAQQRHEAELQAAKDHSEQLKSQFQTEHDAHIAAINHAAEEKMKAIDQSFEMKMAAFQATVQAHLKQIPSVGLAGKMAGVAIASAEEAFGLKPDPTQKLDAIAAPPKPQGNSGKQKPNALPQGRRRR